MPEWRLTKPVKRDLITVYVCPGCGCLVATDARAKHEVACPVEGGNQ